MKWVNVLLVSAALLATGASAAELTSARAYITNLAKEIDLITTLARYDRPERGEMESWIRDRADVFKAAVAEAGENRGLTDALKATRAAEIAFLEHTSAATRAELERAIGATRVELDLAD